MYDLIIIGMGISGMSAAIYAKRNNLNVLVIEKSTPGGLLNKINIVDNYPGFSEVSGPELSYKLFEQFTKNNIKYKIEEVLDVKDNKDYKIITTNKDTYKTKFVIVATGRIPRKLGLENEDKLIGHGISNCALCDGNLYKDKDIAIVGGGNSALEEALYLSRLVSKIYMIHRKSEFTAEDKLVNEILEKDNIEIIYNANIIEILEENDKLVGLRLDNGTTLEVEGLFEYIGYLPGNDFLKNLDLEKEQGYIKVNENFETNIPRIYAVGDSISKKYYQLVLASSDGVTAAIDIINKIK